MTSLKLRLKIVRANDRVRSHIQLEKVSNLQNHKYYVLTMKNEGHEFN